jgi:hypothetical protein
MISEYHIQKSSRVNGLQEIGTCTGMHDKLSQFLDELHSIHLVIRVAFAVHPARFE